MSHFTTKIIQWVIITLLVSLAAGLLSSVFLQLLSFATNQRESNKQLVYFLPLAGLIIGLAYYFLSKGVEGGNNLLISEMDRPKQSIHWKLIPLVFFGTIATHLFGGSAGREGTAVQMGGALGDQIQKVFKWTRFRRKTILRMGVAGGFAGVFGTPLAGVVFAAEFAKDRRLSLFSLFLSSLTAFGSHYICMITGAQHAPYNVDLLPDFSIEAIFWIITSGLVFGLTAWIFSLSKLGFERIFNKLSTPFLRPFYGGIVLLILYLLFDLDKFMGLGIPIIQSAFENMASFEDPWIKLILTAITLGAGFKGGEATPLFFMGALLGSSLANWIPLPLGFMAGAGFVAVFGAATNTPFASSLIAAELFGFEGLPFYLVTCITAYIMSGKTSVYATQQPLLRKVSIRNALAKKKLN
jgi:H+/Cl- antiporter ClcA